MASLYDSRLQWVSFVAQLLQTQYTNLKLDTHQQIHYLLNSERFNFTLKFT
jgi:hypothetical protein